MATIYLALGSNVGDSKDHIQQAVKLLELSVQNIQQAPVYKSKAVGYTDQPDFLNTALQGQTTLSPEDLLALIKTIEEKLGRQNRFRWGPREIDIDIIFYDNQVSESPNLTLPHPEFRSRDFVLQPLYDLNPGMTDPVSDQTITQLLDKIPLADKSILQKVD